jgi:hypothetical protein
MKSYNHLLILLFSLIGLTTFAQTNKKTLNYQAVILDPKAIDIPGASIVGQPLNKGNVCLRFSLLNAQGGLDYEETQQVTTDEYGLVNVAIGTGSQAQASNSTSIYKSFDSILWNSSVKSLKVSVSYDGCSSFKQVSTQSFNYTPYALYAEAVDYKNVRDAPTKLSQFSNDAGYLIPKDLDPLKSDIQTNSSKIEVANKSIADNKQASDATFLVVNQSITSLDNQVAQNTGSISNINTKIVEQQNQIVDNRNQITATNNNLNTQIGGLQGQLNTTNSTVNSLTGVAEVVSNKSTSVNLGGANPSDQLYPSQKAAKSYIDNAIYDAVGSGVPDATTLAAGKVKLAGDLGGTAASPTVPALANKENIGNKSSSVQADGGNDTKYPSVKAVKDYVDQAVNGTALQATVDGKADKLSPTFTGTPTAPTPASSDNSTKLATTAFVQAATAGIALQATVDGKADINSPTFTGAPSLPTGTTGVTQTLGNNSTKLATTAYVDAQVAAGAPEASSSSKGIIQLAGALGGTAISPTVPGLTLKEDLTNKSTAADLGATNASDEKYPSQKAVKTYVDNQVTSVTIPDASSTNRGKLKLAGDLAGTADEPLIATGAITSAKILDGSIATADIADLAITDGKIGGIAGTKVTGNIPGNAANVTGTVTVSHGGTGATDLTGYVKGNGTDAAMTSVSVIPAADVDGAVRMVNGSPPDKDGKVTILFGKVTSGNYANVPTIGGINGDIYIVSGDGNASNNGRTFIKDDTNWNEVSPNTASTDARYLRLGGGTMEGVLTIPTGKALILTDAPTGSTDAANKGYVDAKSAAAAPDATSSVSGKIKLAGDLGGTYDSPSVPGLAAKAPIESPTFTGTVRGITKTMVGLENVENTSDANKPVSDATLTALNLKAPIASPTFSGTATFTGNVSGITATMVGLGNVTNKSEADLAISNATATALSAKENSANKSTATDLGATNASHDKYPSQLAVKTYVDASLSSGAPDADGLTKGKVQLAGDLTGTAALPSIATSAITSAKIADGTIANDDISSSAEISDSKLAEIKSSGKVNNSATTATADNTASAIVARDANRDFSAGTITANLTGNVTGNLTGNVTGNLTGDVTGNAATATKLAATKTINGTAFDGSSDITVTAAAGTLSGTSLNSTVTGSSLTSVGTLTALTTSSDITVNGLTIGRGSGSPNNAENTAVGIGTLKVNSALGTTTQGVSNTAVGFNSLIANTTGSSLTALGHTALYKNTSGSNNVALGQAAMYNNTVGNNNVAIGNASLYTNLNTSGNTAIGKSAGQYLNNNNNTVIGAYSDLSDPTFTNATAIGYGARVKASNSIQLGADGTAINSGAIQTTAITNVMTTGTLTLKDVTYPNTHGSSNQVLTTTGSGTLTWTTPSTTATSFSGSLSGDVTGAQGSTVVGKINGVTLKNLASGLLKNATTTGEPSIAAAGTDYSAGTSGLSSGILKSTTGTGELAIALASDFPTLNQNTTGNASTATTAGNITATSNTTLTSLSNLNTVGTITTGTWSGTAIEVAKGGTGATTAAAALTNLGAQAVTNLSTDMVADALSTSKYPAVKSIKDYVDASVTSSGAPDATTSATGKIQLAGDLGGTNSLASAPVISNSAISTAKLAADAVTSEKIADGTIANIDISSSAGIVDSKLAEIVSSGKVNNSATTATADNTASAIVARDANRDFSAGTITANLTGNVTGNAATATKLAATKNINGVAFDGSSDITVTAAASTLTGTSLNSTVTGSSLTSVGTLTDLTVTNAITGSVTGTAANVTGTVAVANGGTGTSTASPNVVFAGPTSGSTTAAPSFRALVAADIPTLNQNTTGNASTATTAGNITATSNTTLTSLSNLNTVGTITAGTWSGTAIAVEKGGTGSTTALGALTNLGAAPAAGSSSITTVGTITTGTWSGTAIAVEKGGTGSTTALGALTNLGAAPAAGSTSIATVGTINTGTWQGSAIGVGYGGTGSSTATPNHVFAGPATGTTATAPSYRALVGADIPDATETAKGGVSITTQTFAGNKTFTGKIKATNYITTVPALTQATTAATSIDMSTGNIFQINLRANTTVSLTNLSPGTYLFEVIQNGNGAGLPFYNVTWPAWKWSGGAAPTITTTYGKIDVITLVYDGAFYLASAVQNF